MGIRAADAHDKIFGKDPFLMGDDAQIAYRDALIRYLLIHRTSRTAQTFDINLHDPTDWARFAPPQSNPPEEPEADVAGRYLKARADRVAVTDAKDLKALRAITMVSDSSLTQRRRQRDGYRPHTVAEADMAKKGANKRGYSNLDNRLRIAVVGYRVMVSLVPETAYLGEELCIFRPHEFDLPKLESPEHDPSERALPERDWLVPLGRTRRTGATPIQQWKEALSTHIQRAHARHAHIIMLPEFALPPLGTKEEQAMENKLLQMSEDPEVEDHFLLAGTRHEGSVNRALILSKKDKKVSGFWPQFKIAAARSMGENILGGRGKNFPAYSMEFALPDGVKMKATVMVAICYDAFESSTFLRLCQSGALTYSRNASEQLIILVPSFNTSKDFTALLRDLSFLTRSAVVYGDSLNGNAKLFFCGIAISDLYDKAENLEGKLAAVIDDLVRKYDHYRKTRRAGADNDQVTAEEARGAIARLRHKRDVSRTFKKNLDSLRKRGALDHLVTVEPITPKGPANPRLVDDDLLYYNLDLEVLHVLKTFREDFFLNDDFLPKALQLDELAMLD